MHLSRGGGAGHAHIPRRFLPRLRRAGVSDADLGAMTRQQLAGPALLQTASPAHPRSLKALALRRMRKRFCPSTASPPTGQVTVASSVARAPRLTCVERCRVPRHARGLHQVQLRALLAQVPQGHVQADRQLDAPSRPLMRRRWAVRERVQHRAQPRAAKSCRLALHGRWRPLTPTPHRRRRRSPAAADRTRRASRQSWGTSRPPRGPRLPRACPPPPPEASRSAASTTRESRALAQGVPRLQRQRLRRQPLRRGQVPLLLRCRRPVRPAVTVRRGAHSAG